MAIKSPKKPTISNSSVSLFEDCPRCFWLAKNLKIERPRGIFPSLPSGMDRVIKPYYDIYRATGSVPPEIAESLGDSKLYGDMKKLSAYRNWQSGLKYDLGQYTLIGAFDDLVINKDGTYSPWDYKTKGSAPDIHGAIRYYQRQLDTYALLLTKNGMKTNGKGYLVYYYPEKVGENGMVQFKTQVLTLNTNPERAEATLLKAILCLTSPFPPENGKCEYCAFWTAIANSAAQIQDFKHPAPPAVQPTFL